MRLGLGFARQQRDVVPPWVDPEALLAMQFGPDRYWRKGGGLLPATSVLATTRASGINLPDTAGVIQSLGNNTLPRTDRGLYANGQVTNDVLQSANFGTKWGLDNSTASGQRVTANAGTHAAYVEQAVTARPVGVYTIYYDFLAAPGRHRYVWIGDRGIVPYLGATFDLDAVAVIGASAIATPRIINLGGGNIRCAITYSRASTGTSSPQFCFAGAAYTADRPVVTLNGDEFLDARCQFSQSDFAAPYIPTTTAPATLLASDIRAVQGVRPSNSQPEPIPGWEAAGLDDGLTVLLDLENKFVNAAQRRPMQIAQSNGAHIFAFETATDGTFFRLNSQGSTTKAFPGGSNGQMTGRSRVAARILPNGDFALAQQGSGSVNSGTQEAMIALTDAGQMIVGNRHQLDHPWNDWIYGLQICKPLSDAALLEWVNAA